MSEDSRVSIQGVLAVRSGKGVKLTGRGDKAERRRFKLSTWTQAGWLETGENRLVSLHFGNFYLLSRHWSSFYVKLEHSPRFCVLDVVILK